MDDINVTSDDKLCIVGYSGAGKTLILEYVVNSVISQFPNLVIVDPVSRFSERTGIRFRGKIKCLNPSPNKVCLKLQSEADMEELCETINNLDDVPAFLVVDEIDQFTDVHSLMPETSLYLQQGRNYHHGGLFTARQVGRLNKQILSNSHYLILFRIYNKADLQTLNEILPYRFMQLIPKLQPHSFYFIDMQKSEILGEFILEPDAMRLRKLSDASASQ